SFWGSFYFFNKSHSSYVLLNLYIEIKKFMTKTITVSFIILGFLISCNDCTKEEDLLLRESALIQRENSFAEKETEYLSLLKFKDSIQSSMDSLAYQIWPDSIAGRWNSKTL